MEHSFSWVQIIPGFNLLPEHTATATLVMLALVGWALVALRQLRAANDPVVPDDKLSARNLMEMFVDLFNAHIVAPLMGHRGQKYVPLYGTFFLFILASNFCGLLPGFAPPTSNFNVTFALGVISLVAYTYYGFAARGVGYLKHFVGPIWWLAFLMIPLEIIDNLVRPVSLALRLFGNMTGDHVVLEIFTDLTKMVVPVLFYVLGAMVSVIQAFVFTLLSVIYLSLATAHHDAHDEPHHAH
ncbi:MAG: F0F1 ATP synthase subunit A [Deltaproteobacteria bacterium]|nr:F0F1 ATP synthase subunit A [Deltaproteobacteria bacterium]MBI3391196.1 F0F1 ATP synthase subunit A [Deltaproteobacteria bacterium]